MDLPKEHLEKIKPISDDDLRARIEYGRVLRGLKKTDLADTLGIHANTFCKKMKHPSKFTLAEKNSLESILRIDLDEPKRKEVSE